MGRSNDKGRLGEDIAVKHLESNGYKIIGRNVRPPARGHGAAEIDIVAEKGRTLVFCEVKFHKHRDVFEPITASAMKRICRAGSWYFHSHPKYFRDGYDVRYDAIYIRPDLSVEHVEGAWWDEWGSW